MNELQQFINSKPMGFLSEADMPELIRLVETSNPQDRASGKKGKMQTDWYVWSEVANKAWIVTAESLYTAARIVEMEHAKVTMVREAKPSDFRKSTTSQKKLSENDCGGVFDGINTVTSDADLGL